MGTDGNLRGSSSTIFLNPTVMTTDGQGVDDRKLKILFNSTAAKVIWENNKAIGVEYIQDHKINHVYARKAVIVTAGLKSSAFLLRSGVGPKNVLDSLKIPVVYNNPNVGKNLIDQPHISLFFQTNMNDTPLDDNRLKNNPNEVFSQIAWLPDPEGNSKIRAFRMVTINLEPGLATLFLDLNQEKSRGSISINSQDPFDEPVIDSGILNNPEDLSLFIRGFQTYVAAINKSFQAIDPEYKLIYPDPKIINDKKLLTEFIKQEIALTMHFQGHCKMAPLNQGGVVDSTGHVYGVQNLLVADDSVIPVPTDGSTLATAYLVAANIGRILLNDK
jgi:choline dehydrogenase-like flavoprotein